MDSISINQLRIFNQNLYEVDVVCKKCSHTQKTTYCSTALNDLDNDLNNILKKNVSCEKCGCQYSNNNTISATLEIYNSFDNSKSILICAEEHKDIMKIINMQKKYYVPIEDGNIVTKDCPPDILSIFRQNEKYKQDVSSWVAFCRQFSFFTGNEIIQDTLQPAEEENTSNSVNVSVNADTSDELKPISVFDLIMLPMTIEQTGKNGSVIITVTSISQTQFQKLGTFENPTARAVIMLIRNFYMTKSVETCKKTCCLLKIKYNDTIYNTFCSLAQRIFTRMRTAPIGEHQKQDVFVRQILNKLSTLKSGYYADYYTEKIPQDFTADKKDYIFLESLRFDFNIYRKYLRIAPIMYNENIVYKVAWKANGSEFFTICRTPYSRVPDLVSIVNEAIKNTEINYNQPLSIKDIRGVIYYVNPNTHMFEQNGNIHCIRSNEHIIINSTNPSIKAQKFLNKNSDIKELLPKWEKSFELLRSNLLNTSTNQNIEEISKSIDSASTAPATASDNTDNSHSINDKSDIAVMRRHRNFGKSNRIRACIATDNKGLGCIVASKCCHCATEYELNIPDFSTRFPYDIVRIFQNVLDYKCKNCGKPVTDADRVSFFDFYVLRDYVYWFSCSLKDDKHFYIHNSRTNIVATIPYEANNNVYGSETIKFLKSNEWVLQQKSYWIASFEALRKYIRYTQEQYHVSTQTKPSNESTVPMPPNNTTIINKTPAPAFNITKTSAKPNQYYISDSKHSGCNNNLWVVDSVERDIITLRCVNCREEMSVMDEYLQKHFTLYKDNAGTGYSRINEADVIILSGVRRCTSRGHRIEDMIARIVLKNKDRIFTSIVPISYCSDCRRYTMLSTDYKNLQGTPVCTVKTLNGTTVYEPSEEINFESSEHIIHKYGYNVRFGNGLSAADRRQILTKLINSKVLTRSQICEHLEYCIRRNGNRSNMENAIDKWKSDLRYIEAYKPQYNSNVTINSITIKR